MCMKTDKIFMISHTHTYMSKIYSYIRDRGRSRALFICDVTFNVRALIIKKVLSIVFLVPKKNFAFQMLQNKSINPHYQQRMKKNYIYFHFVFFAAYN